MTRFFIASKRGSQSDRLTSEIDPPAYRTRGEGKKTRRGGGGRRDIASRKQKDG